MINVLKARRSEVDSKIPESVDENEKPTVQRQSSSTTIEITPLANQDPIRKQESFKTEQAPSLIKKEPLKTTTESGIKVSSVLKASNQENGVDKSKPSSVLSREQTSQPSVTSIHKKETQTETKPINITSKSISRPTSLAKDDKPVSPTQQQSSTFIMVTSPVRKHADPYVEVTSGGQKQVAAKSVLLQRSETMKENESPDVGDAKKPLKPILRKAKTVEVSVWDPELENVLKKRRDKEDGDLGGSEQSEDALNGR